MNFKPAKCHLYFARSLTTDALISFAFPFLELVVVFTCKQASNSFLMASKIWTLADFLSARVSKVNANSDRLSTRTDANSLSSSSLHYLPRDSFMLFLAAMLFCIVSVVSGRVEHKCVLVYDVPSLYQTTLTSEMLKLSVNLLSALFRHT